MLIDLSKSLTALVGDLELITSSLTTFLIIEFEVIMTKLFIICTYLKSHLPAFQPLL